MSGEDADKSKKNNLKDNLNYVAIAAALVTGAGGVSSSRDVSAKLDVLNVSLVRLEERVLASDKAATLKEARDARQEEKLNELERQITRLQALLDQKTVK